MTVTAKNEVGDSEVSDRPIVLRICYPVSSTVIRVRYATYGTDVGYAATPGVVRESTVRDGT